VFQSESIKSDSASPVDTHLLLGLAPPSADLRRVKAAEAGGHRRGARAQLEADLQTELADTPGAAWTITPQLTQECCLAYTTMSSGATGLCRQKFDLDRGAGD